MPGKNLSKFEEIPSLYRGLINSFLRVIEFYLPYETLSFYVFESTCQRFLTLSWA